MTISEFLRNPTTRTTFTAADLVRLALDNRCSTYEVRQALEAEGLTQDTRGLPTKVPWEKALIEDPFENPFVEHTSPEEHMAHAAVLDFGAQVHHAKAQAMQLRLDGKIDEAMQMEAVIDKALERLEAPPSECDHPWHSNPALITPCPECGASR